MCWISPGKLCVAASLGKYVLHHPWETMSCITPGNLCVGSTLGNYVLSALFRSFRVPSLGSELWSPVLGPGFGPTWPMAHWASMCCITFGTLRVASVLGNYVLHRP